MRYRYALYIREANLRPTSNILNLDCRLRFVILYGRNGKLRMVMKENYHLSPVSVMEA